MAVCLLFLGDTGRWLLIWSLRIKGIDARYYMFIVGTEYYGLRLTDGFLLISSSTLPMRDITCLLFSVGMI